MLQSRASAGLSFHLFSGHLTMKRFALDLASLLLLLALASACGLGGPAEVKVGVLIGPTASPALEQAQTKAALETAVAEVGNGKAGAPRVRLVIAETGFDPKVATRELSRLIENEQVPVVISSGTSDEILHLAPVANRSHRVLIATAAGSEDIRHAGDFIYRTVASGMSQVKTVAGRMWEDLGPTPVAVVASDRAYSVSAAQLFEKEWLSQAGKAPQVYAYPAGRTDFGAIVQRLAAVPPAGILYSGVSQEAAALLQQARAAGLKSRLYVTGQYSQESFERIGEQAEGVVFGRIGWNPDSSRPQARAFVEAYQRRAKEAPGYAAASSYDAFLLVLDAFKAGARSGDEIRKHLDGIRRFPGVQGDLTFDTDGESNLGARLGIWRHGRLEDL
jgi:branched-chain amino acid transport system substrate-binding protein